MEKPKSWWRIVLARVVESGASNGLSDQDRRVGKAAGTLRPTWPTVTTSIESNVGRGGTGKIHAHAGGGEGDTQLLE